ncbi:putative nucleotidyltransferase-like protein [Kineococcus rhizosphaerae]|uniref:Putative nucleotidyltransferase-like protein n=1 Tax=Kineococcus rhizosphaerae TaxID=559628 RepID=A0A2T0R0Y5_9ACTN|nr:putative nucleotidyltransferase-like protein [Kineococcus rhizosphaerae]
MRSLLRGEQASPRGVTPEALGRVVHLHRVGPTVDHLLRTAPDAAALAPLRAGTRPALVAQSARQLPVQLDLRTVETALRGLAWAVVKGPAVARTLYGRTPREFHDLDVVVSPASFGEALGRLEAAGARPMDPDWAGIRAARAGEIAVALPHGTFLDLHWHLVNRPHRRTRFTLDVDAMLGRVRSDVLLGTRAPLFDATDQLHHLALHACLSGAWRLLWSHDLRLAAAACDDAGWDELVARARAAGTGLAVALALARARQVLAAPVPPVVLRRLSAGRGGDQWRAAGTLWTAALPPHRLVSARRNGAVVYQSTAGSGVASLATLAAETARRLRVGPPRPPAQVVLPPDDPRAAREGYLADVASGTA